jgi:large subunit ribosomal protein L31
LHFLKRHGTILSLHVGNVQHIYTKEVKSVQKDIQPKFYQAKVTCNCGNTFTVGSTKPEIHVEICSKCHPFYTGQQKAAAARGRIEAFNKKYGMGK